MPKLLTKAEETDYRQTSLHADVMKFVAGLQAMNDKRLHVTHFGVSPEGRALPLLVLSTKGVTTPAAAKAAGLPVVLIINGIHAGEVEGKEAAMMLVRDMLSGPGGGLLEHMTLLVVPLFNPDGNDRIDPANRVLNIAKFEGQIGPAGGVGTRVNASGINLNRDYLRQDALEMRLLSKEVVQAWEPTLTVDCHATNGSVHRYALTYDVPHTIAAGRREPIEYMRDRFAPEITRRLKARTSLDTFFYGNFVADEGGTGDGWMTYTHHPRFGSNYRGLTNRLDLLAECYSYLTFHDRVFTTYEFLYEVLALTTEWGRDMMQVVATSQMPHDKIAVRSRLDAFPGKIEILTRKPYTLEGEPYTVTVPHFGNFVGTEIVDRPFAYAVPEAVAKRLAGHGLAVRQLAKDTPAALEVATVGGSHTEGSRKILESKSAAETEFEATYAKTSRTLPAGTWICETGQNLGAIAVYLCEARSDDGLVACEMIAPPAPGTEFPALRIVDKI